MSTGISISSINRIKELAEEKKFREALDILDTQNLDKSINPQFLKISGEIFRENKRYYDSRRILLKAHQMAPQGTRILAELIQLYLELGYFTKAKKYYEQYLFYVAPDDTQKDYIEYMMKKATGTDVNDLAAILIPILERMPEDKWNFEAILLYHKMDRKDLALEEARYILETFKESDYVYPVIDYVEDKLDVDYCFYVYPKEEQSEDTILFGDLLEQEDKLLEEDYLRMYPPEARIVVEADDHDVSDVKPVKEKLSKKRFRRRGKKKAEEVESIADGVDNAESADDTKSEKDATGSKTITSSVNSEKDSGEMERESEQKKEDQSVNKDSADRTGEENQNDFSVEEIVNDVFVDNDKKQEREEALKAILAKKIDKDKIKESAKNIAKAVKEIDTSKAKKQIYSVAENVKGNVKKATDAFGDVVGMKQEADVVQESVKEAVVEEDTILDGIIESVLEPPKQTVGQVVTNEELDALIPDSLEAMSEQEIADIEAKREELNRLELEALEASLKLEEEKKAKKRGKLKDEAQEQEIENNKKEDEVLEDDTSDSETKVDDEEKQVSEEKETDNEQNFVDTTSKISEKENATYKSTYEELRNKFIAETEDVKPLDSLGFISVVHSDIDKNMEEQVPDAAGILKQMIDNKEFYSGEDSRKFESKDSYEDHGFEVENFDFDIYRNQEETAEKKDTVSMQEGVEEKQPSVQDIFVEEHVVAFEDVVSEEQFTSKMDEIQPEVTEIKEETVEEPVTLEVEPEVAETSEEAVEEPVTLEVEPEVAEISEEAVEEPVMLKVEPEITETSEEAVEEPVTLEVEPEVAEISEEAVEEPVMLEVEPEVAEISEEAVEEPVTLEIEPEMTETSEEVITESEFGNEQLFREQFTAEVPAFIDEMPTTYMNEESLEHRREKIRTDIVLTIRMQTILLKLKESR